MQITTAPDDQVLSALNNLEARRFHTDLAFRSTTEIGAAARREKTERLQAARIQSDATTQ